MSLKMIFEYSTLKPLLKTFSKEYLSTSVSKNNYSTRYSGLRQKKSNNKRGEWSLLNTGVNLYNKYLLRGEAHTVTRPWDGLAALMWGVHQTAVVSMYPLWSCLVRTCCIEESFSWTTFILAPSHPVVPLLCFYGDIIHMYLSFW